MNALSQISKKRIDRLTKLRREAERREQDALKHMQKASKRNGELRARMDNLDQGYVQEYSSRVAAEMQQAEVGAEAGHVYWRHRCRRSCPKKLASLSIAEERARQAQAQHERRQPEASSLFHSRNKLNRNSRNLNVPTLRLKNGRKRMSGLVKTIP